MQAELVAGMLVAATAAEVDVTARVTVRVMVDVGRMVEVTVRVWVDVLTWVLVMVGVNGSGVSVGSGVGDKVAVSSASVGLASGVPF